MLYHLYLCFTSILLSQITIYHISTLYWLTIIEYDILKTYSWNQSNKELKIIILCHHFNIQSIPPLTYEFGKFQKRRRHPRHGLRSAWQLGRLRRHPQSPLQASPRPVGLRKAQRGTLIIQDNTKTCNTYIVMLCFFFSPFDSPFCIERRPSTLGGHGLPGQQARRRRAVLRALVHPQPEQQQLQPRNLHQQGGRWRRSWQVHRCQGFPRLLRGSSQFLHLSFLILLNKFRI